MKRRRTTALLLGMALTAASLGGCAREDAAGQTDKTETGPVQEEALLEQRKTAGGGIPSYGDYLEMNHEAAKVPEDVRIEIQGGGIFQRG